jgi:hypothetical protein
VYRKWDSKTRARCVELYKAGWSANKVNVETGVPVSTMRHWFIAEGLKLRKNKDYAHTREIVPPKKRQLIIDLYLSGRSTREVAAVIGCTEVNIRYILRRSGVPARTRSEAQRLAHARRRRKREASLALNSDETTDDSVQEQRSSPQGSRGS